MKYAIFLQILILVGCLNRHGADGKRMIEKSSHISVMYRDSSRIACVILIMFFDDRLCQRFQLFILNQIDVIIKLCLQLP